MKILESLKDKSAQVLSIGEQRMAVCETCPDLTYLTLLGVSMPQCKICHCMMRAKVLLPDAKCPKDKW